MKTYFQSPLLSQIDFIDHAFFGRNGGVSSGVYSSLNTSYKLGDLKENVDSNRSIIAKKFNLKPNKLLTLNQVHSTKIINVNNLQEFENTHDIEADGMITADSNIVLGVYTADCIPILFVDTISKNIAAIHCGWKGLLNGIIQNTINEFNKISPKNNLIMVIGPCIHQESYEVDDKFYGNFISKDTEAKKFFKQIDKKYAFNLPLYAYNIGIKLGINKNNLDIINLDTYKNEDLLFSHRRSTHKNEGKGLQLSCITIKSKE
ncbi:MAG: peptidoglycan editing factor PgeF [Alphaproteobacteria bacterium]|jgi:YfiH family protein|nr:peptidoglycan editing factor PgeF [Alphaproteobacteria bacterium]